MRSAGPCRTPAGRPRVVPRPALSGEVLEALIGVALEGLYESVLTTGAASPCGVLAPRRSCSHRAAGRSHAFSECPLDVRSSGLTSTNVSVPGYVHPYAPVRDRER
jgi:hypothetical protein